MVITMEQIAASIVELVIALMGHQPLFALLMATSLQDSGTARCQRVEVGMNGPCCYEVFFTLCFAHLICPR